MGHGEPTIYLRLKWRFLSLTAESSDRRLLPPNQPAEGPPLKSAALRCSPAPPHIHRCHAPPLARSAARVARSSGPPPAPRALAFGRPARLAGGPQPAAAWCRSPGPGAPALGRTPGRGSVASPPLREEEMRAGVFCLRYTLKSSFIYNSR